VTSFAENFREHVTPKLREEIAHQALQLACDTIDWQDAFQIVLDMALRYGAIHLRDDIFYDLRDWIGSMLLDAVGNAENAVGEVERQAQANPIGHYESLAASCSDPDAMRWVFAAISPEYRKSLLAVRRAGGTGGA
jgi:hypothetical protein